MRPARTPREMLRVKPPEGYVGLAEAAELSGLGRKTIAQHAARGDVAGAMQIEHRGGHVWALPRESVAELRARVTPRPRVRAAPVDELAARRRQAPQLGKSGEVKEWLPVPPLAAWVRGCGLSPSGLAAGSEPIERGLRRMLAGIQHVVALGWADVLLIEHEVHLEDVWCDADVWVDPDTGRPYATLDDALAEGHRIRFANQGKASAAGLEALARIRAELDAEDRAA
jgi:hypothetical protein